MVLFLQPPPPPPVPTPYFSPSPTEVKKFQEAIIDPLTDALDKLLYFIQNHQGQPSPSLLHYYGTMVFETLSDKKSRLIWPIIYPSSQFETNLL